MPNIFDTTLGRIETERDFPSYQISIEDAVYLGVASNHEDGRFPELVAWCMIQRFVSMHTSFRTLSVCIKQFSQPVNPIWAYPTDRARAVSLGGSEVAWDARFGTPARFARSGSEGGLSQDKINQRITNINTIQQIINGNRDLYGQVVGRNVQECIFSICTGQCGNPIPNYTDFGNTKILRDLLSSNINVFNNHHIQRMGSGNIFIENSPRRINKGEIRGQPLIIRAADGSTDSSQQPARSFPGSGRVTQRNISSSGTTVSSTSRSVSSPSGIQREFISGIADETQELYTIPSQDELRRVLDEWSRLNEEGLSQADHGNFALPNNRVS